LLVFGVVTGIALLIIRFKGRAIVLSFKQSDRDVASDVDISSEWIEITPKLL